MDYKTINNIFDLMLETEEQSGELDIIRRTAKTKGDVLAVETILSTQKAMTTAILGYHNLIVDYVNSADAVIDDFDEDIDVFLENNKYYSYDEWNEYKYSDEAIVELKEIVFSQFISELYSAVIDDNFYSSDEAIQSFINGFSKIDLYLYILSK